MNNQPNSKKTTGLAVGWGVAAIVGLFLVTGAITVPQYFNKGINVLNDKVSLGLPTVPEKSFKLGLDLQGGVQLIYQADVSQVEPGQEATAVEGARDVIERRVNGMGVGEATVQTAQVDKKFRLNVELPGVTDVNQAIKMIGETPILEFKEQSEVTATELTAEQQKQLNDHNTAAKTKAEAWLARIKKGESFETVVTESEDEISVADAGKLGFIPNSEPVTELYAWAKANKEGAVSQTVIKTPQGYNVVKRGAERQGKEEVKASHILVCYLGAKNCVGTMSKEEAKTKAEELVKQATVKNFAQLAKENSTDLSNKETGGDLGYFAKEAMVPAFAEAAFAAKNGQIVGPVETEFGYHVIYRAASRQDTEYEVSRILATTKTEADILGVNGAWKTTGLSGKQLQKAQVVSDPQTGATQVSLQFNSEGADLFREITQRNLQKPIAIFLDNEPISVPNVNVVIPDGQAVIQGTFTLAEAKLLAQRLNAGALPVPVELVSQQVIGATLGAEALDNSLKAGAVSLGIIMLFMILVYRLPGLISAISLCLYTLLTLVLFKYMGVTITLAGIAGFIMSLGVAIDANVLIFERLKEELGLGKNLRQATEEGFVRAWTSIRDGNAATIITAVILIWFGSSFVQGFALTLIIGTLVSLFTAITVTRTLMRFILPWFKNNGGWLFLGATKKN